MDHLKMPYNAQLENHIPKEASGDRLIVTAGQEAEWGILAWISGNISHQ